MPVNCAAIPADLVENELFGHEPGAFTGAEVRAEGLVRAAAGGTLFLDEVDSLALGAQAKLLRLLQQGEYRPLGSTRTYAVDFRVIAATNVDPREAIGSNVLREDFFFRLSAFLVTVPPLRERPGDIEVLAQHFLSRAAQSLERTGACLSAEAKAKLMVYDWPGNIRELEHTVQRAVTIARDPNRLNADDIVVGVESPFQGTYREAKARAMERFERNYVRAQLVAHDGNVSQAARASGVDRQTLRRLIRKHGIDVKRCRRLSSE